jgi:hypothetical protein
MTPDAITSSTSRTSKAAAKARHSLFSTVATSESAGVRRESLNSESNWPISRVSASSGITSPNSGAAESRSTMPMKEST